MHLMQVLDFGNQIRARSVATQTFEIQLCCGALGYLPTEKAEKPGAGSRICAGRIPIRSKAMVLILSVCSYSLYYSGFCTG